MGSASSRQIYKPLNKDRKEIRLLHVFGPKNEGLLRAELKYVSLDSKPEYEAISYCWNEVPGEDYIMLDGTIWKAPASAVKVLHRFQPFGDEQYIIWIDAICINQADLEERALQVQLMGDIYRSCERCIIWLGDYEDSVAQAFRFLDFLLKDTKERTADYEHPLEAWEVGNWEPDVEKDIVDSQALANQCVNLEAALEALARLLERPWFSRLWVLQEACLPWESICYCGHLEVFFSDLCLAIEWGVSKHSHLLSERLPPFGTILWIRHAFQFIWLDNQEVKLDCLLHLLPASKMLQVSEPLDRAFAILGLTDRENRPHLWPQGFVVNYQQSYNRTIALMQRASMAHGEHGVDMVTLLWAGIGHTDPEAKNELPSWIMRHEGYTKTLEMWDKPFTARDGHSIGLEDMLNAETPEILSLQGFILDEIVAVMPVIDRSVLETITALRRAFLSFVAFIESRSTIPRPSVMWTVARTLCAGGHVKTPALCRTDVHSDEEFTDSLNAFLESKDDGRYPAFFSSEFHFATAAADVSINRRLLLSANGYIGLGPATTEVGDVVSIMFGCRIPFVLRHESSKEDWRLLLNGGCYIDGIMFGQAMREHVDAGLPMQTINLV